MLFFKGRHSNSESMQTLNDSGAMLLMLPSKSFSFHHDGKHCYKYRSCVITLASITLASIGEYFYFSTSKLLLHVFSSSRAVIFKSGCFVQKYWSGTVARNTDMGRGMDLMICIRKRQLKWSLKSWKRRQNNEL